MFSWYGPFYKVRPVVYEQMKEENLERIGNEGLLKGIKRKLKTMFLLVKSIGNRNSI